MQPGKQGQNSGGQSSNRDAAVNLMRKDQRLERHGDRRITTEVDNYGKRQPERTRVAATRQKERRAIGRARRKNAGKQATGQNNKSKEGDSHKDNANQGANKQSQKGDAPGEDGAKRSSSSESKQDQPGADSRQGKHGDTSESGSKAQDGPQ